MSIFQDQKDFLKRIRDEIIYNSMQDVFNQFDFVVVDLVVNKQLFQKGIDGKGKKLRPYKRTTIRIKKSKGQRTDVTTLHDEEEFAKSIHIDVYDDRFEIISDVPHDKFLVKNYGRSILEPTQENIEEFMNNYFLPKLRDNVNNEFTK